MTKKKLDLGVLHKRFDEEIKPLIEKIVLEEALTGVVSNEVILDYWAYLNVGVEIPVVFKGSKAEGKVRAAFNVEINIVIEEGEEEI